MALVLVACGGGGGVSATCGAFVEVQRTLRVAVLDEGPAAIAAVERELATLAEEASDRLRPAANEARKGWAAYRQAGAAEPRSEFAVQAAYGAALRPLEAFTAECGTAP